MSRLAGVLCGLLCFAAAISTTAFTSYEVYQNFGQQLPPAVPGLAYGFYNKSCPNAEAIVKKVVNGFLSPNISEAAGLLRLFFHDCFVQGCDASVLINDPQGEQQTPPNFTLRPSALAFIDRLKKALDAVCPNVVSCADALALATRDAIAQAGGPSFPIPTGRRDSLNFASSTGDLPGPGSDASNLIAAFAAKTLGVIDMVTLSGAHTIGLAHCNTFNNRILPAVDPTLNPIFAKTLRKVCPKFSVNVPTDNDIVTPNLFDKQYYQNVIDGRVLFNSDTALIQDVRTKNFVLSFSANQSKFFDQFTQSFIKMSMIQVLTGTQGNIRKQCSVFNPISSIIPLDQQVVKVDEESSISTDIQ